VATFILAGYQRSLAQHVKRALEREKDRFGSWAYVLFPSEKSKEPSISLSQVDEIQRLAAANGGAHVYAVSSDRERQQIEHRISPYFRFRWLPTRVVGLTGKGEVEPLIETLTAATTEDEYWLEHVKPKDSASPLILPQIFVTTRPLSEMWRLSLSYNNEGHLQAAATLIDRFTKEHRKRVDRFDNTPWLSADEWIWDDGGERHGDPDFPNDWKYSFRLPNGFHFDVSPLNKKNKTSFPDLHGTRHSFNQYLNITAHGEVRGVKRPT
jgi:hypothetical protein